MASSPCGHPRPVPLCCAQGSSELSPPVGFPLQGQFPSCLVHRSLVAFFENTARALCTFQTCNTKQCKHDSEITRAHAAWNARREDVCPRATRATTLMYRPPVLACPAVPRIHNALAKLCRLRTRMLATSLADARTDERAGRAQAAIDLRWRPNVAN